MTGIVDVVPNLRGMSNVLLAREHARIVSEVTGQTDQPLPSADQRLPGDTLALRGIPVVGTPGGRGGAIRGSRPTDAIGR